MYTFQESWMRYEKIKDRTKRLDQNEEKRDLRKGVKILFFLNETVSEKK